MACALVALALAASCGRSRPTAIPPGPRPPDDHAAVPDPRHLQPLPWSLYFLQADELVAWPRRGGAFRVLAGPDGGDIAAASRGVVSGFGVSPRGRALVCIVAASGGAGVQLVQVDLAGEAAPETASLAWSPTRGAGRIEVALSTSGQSIAWVEPTAQGDRVGLWQPPRDPTALADCAPDLGPDAGCHDLMFSRDGYTLAYADGAGLHVTPVLRFGMYASAPAPFAPDAWSGSGDLLLVRRGRSQDSPRGLLSMLPAGPFAQATREAAVVPTPTEAVRMLDPGQRPGERWTRAWAGDGKLIRVSPGPRPRVTLVDPGSRAAEDLAVPEARSGAGATELWPAGVHGSGKIVLVALVAPRSNGASGVYRLVPGKAAALVAPLTGAATGSGGAWAAGDVWWSPDGSTFLAGRADSGGTAPTYAWLILGRTDTGAAWDVSGVLSGATGFRFGR